RAQDGGTEDERRLINWVLKSATEGEESAREAKLVAAELNDVAMQIFRSSAITGIVSAVINAFEKNYDAIMEGTFDGDLIGASAAAEFVKRMKKFDFIHGYQHRDVLAIELRGHVVIRELMDMLWEGITDRESFEDVGSKRRTPFARYTYRRISENYRRLFEGRVPKTRYDAGYLPIRYRELQLLTDMIAGMTDQYALNLHTELKALHGI
ncbi:hypothetical protein N9H93_06620, partial [Rhizobiaceae bacterium]|nr:hypothetical protein [Rhizobiaceae bacterium]